jgi:GNAT superfamily N-acetyltransferase
MATRTAAGLLVTRRTVTPGDEPFLRTVFASTRLEELSVLAWNPSAQEQFLDLQHRAQSHHWRTNHPDADYEIVLVDGVAAGRLYVERSDECVDVLDVALLPDHRGRGIGTRLMLEVIDEARRAGLPVRLHVERFNRARRLYDRLGFQEIADAGVYARMELAPASRA